MARTIGEAIAGIGFIIILCGFIGLIRSRAFYTRLLVSALIDTVGILLVLIGMAVRQGWTAFTWKLILLMVILVFVNPLLSHKIGRAAFISGHRDKERGKP